jgi:NAD+ synthase (glutamine-hydrolysing)
VAEIVEAPPTAELQPLKANQTDEQDMGMTYEELSHFGKLRKPANCGPFSMTARLLHTWKDKHEPSEIARKVKHFYTSYASNRYETAKFGGNFMPVFWMLLT